MRINTLVFAAVASACGILGGVLLVVLVLFCILLSERLQPPSPTPPVAREVPKKNSTPGDTVSTTDDKPSSPDAPTLDQNKSDPKDWPEQKHHSKEDHDASDKWWGWFNPTAVTCFTFMLMVLAGLQWWAMRRQWQVMGGQLAESQRSIGQTDDILRHMQLEQRPWLAPTGATVNHPFIDGVRLILRFPLHNYGSTPARIIEQKLYSLIEQVDVKFEVIVKRFGRLPVGSGIQTVIPHTLHVLTGEQIDDIEHGRQILYFMARFVYADIWDVTHPVEFCYCWDRGTSRLYLHEEFMRMHE